MTQGRLQYQPRFFPFVTVIIPCRNEVCFIGPCLNAIIASDYPKDLLEVLVVDGISDDGTRDIVASYGQQHSYIRLCDNPRQIIPVALNLGVQQSVGSMIMRIDARSQIEKNYIGRCLEAIDEHHADCVGGFVKILPHKEGIVGKAIAATMSHRFGVGSALYKEVGMKGIQWVDTVFNGCYKREAFSLVGCFNEKLARGQDIEFHVRLKKAGGRILLVSDVCSYYRSRTEMASYIGHYWINGVWAVLPFAESNVMPVAWRHLVPLAFVLSILGSAAAAFFSPIGKWLFLSIIGSYFFVNILSSFQVALREKQKSYVILLPFVFTALHLAYGFGSLWGVMKLIRRLPQLWNKVSAKMDSAGKRFV